MSSTFQKKVENFKCEICGEEVKGDGYTDHCPNCLYGKHVDDNPGDRKSKCHGLMEPVSVEVKGGKNTIRYVCKRCGKSYKVRAAPNDNPDRIIELSTH